MLYHAPLSFEPTWTDTPSSGQKAKLQIEAAMDQAKKGSEDAEEVAKALIEEEKWDKAWIVDEEMMKVFVNSERWTLGQSQQVHLGFKLKW